MTFDGRLYRVASWIGIAIGAGSLALSVLNGWWIASIWLAGLLVYSLWQVVWETRLPDLFDLLLVAAAVINALGWAFNLFAKIGFYDIIAHGYTIFAITLSAGFLVYSGSQVHFDKLGWLFVTSIFCFGMALGGLWEIVEWLFGVIGDIRDTVGDLTMDATGAFAAGLFSCWVARRGRRQEPAAGRSRDPLLRHGP